MPLTDNHLTLLRRRVATFLSSECTIKAMDYLPDGRGGSVQIPRDLGTVACKLDPLNSVRDQVSVKEALGRESLEMLYRLTTPYDSPLAEDCAVVIGERTFQVVQLEDIHSWSLGKRAIIVEQR